MTMQRRDLLVADPAVAEGSSNALSTVLLAEQSDWLQDIALSLRKQNPDVLCSAVVHGTSQLRNAISDTNDHEVSFEVGGKPSMIYSLMAFSTYTQTVTLSILSTANALDGIPMVAGDTVILPLNISSVYLRVNTLAGGVSPVPCPINGPADATQGGFFIYGSTIPDYDRIRGGRHS